MTNRPAIFYTMTAHMSCYLCAVIYLAWGKVKLTIWTHKIDGLTESDFIFAAKASEQL